MEKCKECIYKTTDHYCSHEQFIDSEGHMAPARYVWFVGNNKDTVKNYCAGKYFKHVNGTVPNAIAQGREHSERPAGAEG